MEIGTDSKTIQDMLRWADPSILLKVYAHSRMEKRMEAQAKMIESHGSERRTRSTAYPLGVGDRPWAILPVFGRQISAKCFEMVVARDGVELPTPAFSGLVYVVV